MFDITDVKNCTGCLACLNVCPYNAIEVNYNEMVKLYLAKLMDDCVIVVYVYQLVLKIKHLN